MTNALGFAGVEVLSKVIAAITEKDSKAVLAVVDDLIGRGHDLRNFCRDVLSLFRDLLVFKIAGDESGLFETAVFNADQMREMSAAFSEADLLRFFNSLCETEASLREAAHPRYVLEVGLIKLLEMRSVATIESILERLNALNSGVRISNEPVNSIMPSASATAAAAVSPVQEKKTLKVEATAPVLPPVKETLPEPPVEPESKFDEEPPEDFSGFDEPVFESPIAEKAVVEERYIPPTTRLSRLSADELEHIEDQKLDDAYESKLTFSGDDLLPIANVASLLETLTGVTQEVLAKPVATNGNSGAAAAPAIDIKAAFPQLKRENEGPVEIPELGDAPTEEELIEYAKAHTHVRVASRIFRAKIVEARKI